MSIMTVGIGFMMLVAGRPIYAVFIGGIGFLLGNFLAREFNFAPAGWGGLAFPIIAAILGVLLTFALKRWIARLACFLAGGFLAFDLPVIFGAEERLESWIVFAVVGVICVVLSIVWFDYTLIILSTLIAVTMILQSVRFGLVDIGTMFFILVIFGLIAQYLILQYGRPSPD